jgi:UDP-N-acetylglucosamine transferase subunit ALG13
MIFVTAGTQEPFDRLLKVIDDLASHMHEKTFVVQSLPSDYKPQNITVLNFIPSEEFNNYVDEAELIISHAGTGTIISALEKNKPIIIMPRLLMYHEHRNEHQLATARKMDELGYVDVAYDEDELKSKFLEMWPNKLKSRYTIGKIASEKLIQSIQSFIKF